MLERLVDLIVNFLELFMFWEIIDEFEKGVVLTLGKTRRKNPVLGPGIHWKWPLGIDEVLTENIVETTMNLQPQSLTTSDGMSVVVSGIITWRIKDVRKMILEIEDAEDVIRDTAYGIIARYTMNNDWDHMAHPDYEKEITSRVRRASTKRGIEVRSMQFSDIAKVRSFRLIK